MRSIGQVCRSPLATAVGSGLELPRTAAELASSYKLHQMSTDLTGPIPIKHIFCLMYAVL